MGELNADCRLLALHEGDERLEALRLRVIPDAKIVLVDQANLLDRGGLDKDQPKALERIAAEMHVVKGVAGAARSGPVVTIGGTTRRFFERQAADRERLEQQGACVSMLSVTGADMGRLLNGTPQYNTGIARKIL